MQRFCRMLLPVMRMSSRLRFGLAGLTSESTWASPAPGLSPEPGKPLRRRRSERGRRSGPAVCCLSNRVPFTWSRLLTSGTPMNQLSARPEPWAMEYRRGDADLSAAAAAGTAVCCHQAHSAAQACVWPTISTTSSAALNMVMPYVSCAPRESTQHMVHTGDSSVQGRQQPDIAFIVLTSMPLRKSKGSLHTVEGLQESPGAFGRSNGTASSHGQALERGAGRLLAFFIRANIRLRPRLAPRPSSRFAMSLPRSCAVAPLLMSTQCDGGVPHPQP